MKHRLHVVMLFVITVCIADAGSAVSAGASIQGDDVCWTPDVEFPVPCDDDED